jgi:hypothetical protein
MEPLIVGLPVYNTLQISKTQRTSYTSRLYSQQVNRGMETADISVITAIADTSAITDITFSKLPLYLQMNVIGCVL